MKFYFHNAGQYRGKSADNGQKITSRHSQGAVFFIECFCRGQVAATIETGVFAGIKEISCTAAYEVPCQAAGHRRDRQQQTDCEYMGKRIAGSSQYANCKQHTAHGKKETEKQTDRTKYQQAYEEESAVADQ